VPASPVPAKTSTGDESGEFAPESVPPQPVPGTVPQHTQESDQLTLPAAPLPSEDIPESNSDVPTSDQKTSRKTRDKSNNRSAMATRLEFTEKDERPIRVEKASDKKSGNRWSLTKKPKPKS